MKLVDELLVNLKQQQAVSSSIKILQVLITSFAVRETEKDQLTQQAVVSELVQSHGLVNILLECIIWLKNEIREKAAGEKEWPNSFTAQYMVKLSERVTMIKTLIKINGKASEIVTIDFLNTVWNEMVLRPLCKLESDLACKWIKDLVEKEKDADF